MPDSIRNRTPEEDKAILDHIDSLCIEEHLPPPVKCYIRTEISDQDGNVESVQEFRSMSWVRNFYNMIAMKMLNVYSHTIGGFGYGDGYLGMRGKDYGISLSTYETGPSYAIKPGLVSEDDIGLIVGSSDIPENFEMCNLGCAYADGQLTTPGRLHPVVGAEVGTQATYIYTVQFSPDGTYLVRGGVDLQIFKNLGNDRFSLVQSQTAPFAINHIAWHPSNTYFVASSYTSPYIAIYKNNGNDTFTKLPDLSPASASYPYQMQFSPNGTYLALGIYGSPYLYIYKNNGDDTFTRLSITAPAGRTKSLAWSPNGTYLVFCSESAPFVNVYKNNGNDTFTKINPTDMPSGGYPYGVSWHPNNNYFIVVGSASPYAWVYKNNGNDTFTKIDLAPGNTLLYAAWSPDANYIVVINNTLPIIYKNNGNDTFTKLTSPAALSYSVVSADYYKGLQWLPDSTGFMCATGSSYGGMQVVRLTAADTFTTSKAPKWIMGNTDPGATSNQPGAQDGHMHPTGAYYVVAGNYSSSSWPPVVTIYKIQPGLNYQAGTISYQYRPSDKKFVATVTRVVNNNSPYTAHIKEIGMVYDDFMMCRDILPQTDVLYPAKKDTITLTFEVTIPAP